jgi:hypothetical protein
MNTDLTPTQASTLERLLRAGFRFVTIPHVERYMTVEKNGFVGVLEPFGGGYRLFGQIGYWMGEGMGVLVERQGQKVFVLHEQTLPATPELLAMYERFRAELASKLEIQA